MRIHFILIIIVILLMIFLYQYQENRIAGRAGFPLDDSWIHLRFAKNFAEGYGFSFNKGIPVAGSTAPLWTVILALIYKISGNIIIVAKISGIFFLVVLCLAVYFVALFITNNSKFALFSSLATGMTGRLIWGGLSGMEITLYSALSTAGLYFHLKNRDEDLRGFTATALFALAGLARPECYLLFLFSMIDRFFAFLKRRKISSLFRYSLGIIIHVAIFILILTPYFLFNYSAIGKLFPATFYAKVEGGIWVLFEKKGWETLLESLLVYPLEYVKELLQAGLSDNMILTLFVIPGMIAFFVKKEYKKFAILPVIIVSHPVIVALLSPYRGPAFQQGRYSAHLVPLIVITGMLGIYFISEFVEERFNSRKIKTVIISAIFFYGAINSWSASKIYALNVSNINDMQVKMGMWVRDNINPDALIAVNDVGAITFFSDRNIIDLVGLVSPEILSFKKRGEDGILEYLDMKKPDYLIIFPNWFPKISGMRERFREIYFIKLNYNTISGGDVMVVYETPWTRWPRLPQRR